MALVAALIFLLLSSCAAYLSFTRLNTSQQWVHHTREVQDELAQFTMAMGRAGRVRVEYIEKGDAALLARYGDEVGKLRAQRSEICRLTSDNEGQQAACNRLSDALEKRIAVMDESIDLKRSGKSTLELQNQFTGRIVAAAAQIDAVLKEMYDTEQNLLSERQDRVQRSLEITSAVLITSLFLTLVLFLIHNQLLTEQVRARTKAENAQRALSARLLIVQDQERRKIARELHDSVGQHLAALKMAISLMQKRIPDDRTLDECLSMLDDAITETRTISHLLHPPLLDEAGLNSAMRWFVEGFAKRSNIQTNLQIPDQVDRFPDSVELVLFRVLQESLTNVHRHSGAKHAEVSLSTADDRILLRVRDDGRGMPADLIETLGNNGSGAGVGLAGMAERAREVGGKFKISSNNSGTEISLEVPIRRNIEAGKNPASGAPRVEA